MIQSSEIDKMIWYVPPLEEVKILQFEDTLSEEDRKNFNLIYESLLLEGKAGNLRFDIGDGISWKTSDMVAGHAWKVKTFDYQFWKV